MKLLLIAILLTSVTIARAQDTVVSYMDKNWKKTKQENASYYRKLVKVRNSENEKRFLVLDYYLTDTLQMSGYYKDRKLTIKDGDFVYYYENGQKSMVKTYVNGKTEGFVYHYYENGTLSSSVNTVHGLNEGQERNYFEHGQLLSEVIYLNDKMNGVCKWYYENGQPSSIEVYEADSLISFELFLETGEKDTLTPSPFMPAEFPGGMEKLKRYLSVNIIYPDYALKHNIEGKVYIRFVVDKTGLIENITVLKSPQKLLDEEAVRVVKKMPDWKPCKYHNRAIPSVYHLPITFKLQ